MSELIEVKNVNKLEIYTTEKGLEPFLKEIRKKIDDFNPDMTSLKGRKEIASMASKVARSKTYLDGIGKELVGELKKQPVLVDRERKRVRDILDSWKEEVRAPLTDWENKEKNRIKILENCLENLERYLYPSSELSLIELKEGLEELNEILIDDDWDEFKDKGLKIKNQAILNYGVFISNAETKEQEKVELEMLRKKEEERKQKEREEQIRKEAEEKATKEAEEKIRLEKEASLRREIELKLKTETAVKEKKEAIEKAERDKKEAAEKAEREKIEAVENEKRIAKENKQREERSRVAKEQIAKDKKEKEDAIELKRQENLKHRRKINNEILKLLIEKGISSDQGEGIITLAAQGKLGNLYVRY